MRAVRSIETSKSSRLMDESEIENRFDEFIDDDFVSANTEFDSFGELLDDSPWSIERYKDLMKVSCLKWDAFIDEHTDFKSWFGMLKHLDSFEKINNDETF